MKKFLCLIICILTLITVNLSAQEIYYSHIDKSLEEIQNSSVEWHSYDAPIHNGFDNGIYWFKIILDSDEDQILHIPESHIAQTDLYSSEGIEIGRKEFHRFTAYPLLHKDSNLKTYYLKLNCLLDASIDIQIQSKDAYAKDELRNYMVIGVYIGIALCILLFNFFSYFSFKDTTYLLYISTAIGLLVQVLYKDGFFAILFDTEGINESLELPLNLILVVGGLFFVSKIVSFKEHLPKLRMAAIILAFMSIFSCVAYLISRDFTLFVTTIILNYIAYDVLMFSTILLWEKSLYARVIVIAYCPILILAHLYNISPHFGFSGLNVSLDLFKVASIFEMLVFTYMISYRSKSIAKENNMMRDSIFEYSKSIEELEKQLEDSVQGVESSLSYANLSPKEANILSYISKDKTYKEIAESLNISVNTVKYHVKNLYAKLDVKNKQEAKNKVSKSKRTSNQED